MRVFVTGAASPLGRSLTRLLTQHGNQVVGQVRRSSGVHLLRKLDAEPAVGDLMNATALAEAMSGCDVLFHVAQFFDFWAPDRNTFMRVNATGTRNALAAAALAGVKRIVVSSSAITVGEPPGHRGDEWTRHRGYTLTHVERSLLAAETLAWSARPKGVDVIVVLPALVLAPADTGWTGRMIARHLARGSRYAYTAPCGWVWVDDAAQGLARAAAFANDGDRFILSGDTLSPRMLLREVSRIAGRREPRAIPQSIALRGARMLERISAHARRRPSVPLDEARFGTTGFQVVGSHATEALGLEYTPLERYLPRVVSSYTRTLARRQPIVSQRASALWGKMVSTIGGNPSIN